MTSDAYVFTSESVSEGHPDKICDRISDAVLDAYLAEDPEARVACECLAIANRVVLAGEVRGPERLSSDEALGEIVRDVVRRTGYEQDGFHWQHLEILNFITQQSSEIATGVDLGGAGDQGLMFGYAVDETEDLMPAPIHYSHAILRMISEARRVGKADGIGPDGKVQLSVVYQDDRPRKVETIVLSHQHDRALDAKMDVREILEPIVRGVLPEGWLDDTQWLVNPSDSFIQGGPAVDAGLTGRKIIVDTYGGAVPHGGGAFSGKDPTKVDRSAAYAARYLAKNVVAAGLARRCTIQISYAIGKSEPVSFLVDTRGTGTRPDGDIAYRLRKAMDLTPDGIRKHLELGRPIYERTASYGHFGRKPEEDGGFSWERVDLVDRLRDLVT